MKVLALPLANLMKFPWLTAALQPAKLVAMENPVVRPDAIAAWGQKLSARYARKVAKIKGLPFYTLEDGFYRSVGLGKSGASSFSVILDQQGIYFDCRAPSNLETMLAEPISNTTIFRGKELREFIVRHRLSKYNHIPDHPVHLDRGQARRRILLIDQVAGDRSIVAAGADSQAFYRMWQQAKFLQVSENAQIFIKAHPDVVAGYGRGMLADAIGTDRADWVVRDAAPHALLDEVDEIWTVSSQFGFDGLLRGKTTVTFAAPFYAGWGLTDDRVTADGYAAAAIQRRSTRKLTLDELSGVALSQYPLYFDPVLQKTVTPEAALERLVNWRDRWFAHQGRVLAIGFAWHKRKLIRAHLGSAGKTAVFCRKEPLQIEFENFSEIIAWSDRIRPETLMNARKNGVQTYIVEDGFIRSRGLSSWRNLPVSLCLDSKAAHFDADQQSDLEMLLKTNDFSPQLIARAALLREFISTNGVSKYNIKSSMNYDFRKMAAGRAISLVVAQVPGDASLRHGKPLYSSNIDFLKAVRKRNPADFIIFKEHPDLIAGKRQGKTAIADAQTSADFIISHGDLTEVYGQIDEIHVMTSLAGFEALIRGKRVVCHGLPFYAGWGLTQDKVFTARRGRVLSVEALVAAALILYPKYIKANSLLPCSVEEAMSGLD